MQSSGCEPDLNFLDDTGATMPSLFELDDMPLLGIVPGGSGWSSDILINTAAGLVVRKTVHVWTKWMCAPGVMMNHASRKNASPCIQDGPLPLVPSDCPVHCRAKAPVRHI
jgi:hypothetical protein